MRLYMLKHLEQCLMHCKCHLFTIFIYFPPGSFNSHRYLHCILIISNLVQVFSELLP